VHAFVHETWRDRLRRGETQKAREDSIPQVCRGQRGDQGQPETPETNVVWLITQRSRVQNPSPATKARGPFSNRERAF